MQAVRLRHTAGAAAIAAMGCLGALAIFSIVRGPRTALAQQGKLYDQLYHLHSLPRKRLVRELSDPMPAFVPSRPARSFLIDQAARDRNRVDVLEMQLASAKQQQLSARKSAAHRGLMAPSRHGSDRLFHLLAHQAQDERKDESKALAMASADFAAPPHREQTRTAASSGEEDAANVQSEIAAQARARHDNHQLGALDLVQEGDENVLGSLGGEEDFDEMNRDGSLRGASNDRNSLGSLFAVHAPSQADEVEAGQTRQASAQSFRYRRGHWSHDGLLWIVGDGEGHSFRAQQSLKSGLANSAHGDNSLEGHAIIATSAVADRGETIVSSAVTTGAATGTSAVTTTATTEKSSLAKTAYHAARARRQHKADAVAPHSTSTLSTGPLSLKRLLKDVGQYEAEFGAFFRDDTHAKRRPHFAHAPRPEHRGAETVLYT